MTVHVVVQGADGLNRRAFSADDVRRMTEVGILGENDPFELIDGELIEMAAKGFAHDRVKNELLRELFRVLDPSFYIAAESTLRLDAATLVEPDILVCRQSSVRRSDEGYVEIAGRDILLLIEVAESSLRYDKIKKATLYAAHGVEDYWIADLNGRQTILQRGPGSTGYGQSRDVPATEAVRPLAPEVSSITIRLADYL